MFVLERDILKLESKRLPIALLLCLTIISGCAEKHNLEKMQGTLCGIGYSTIEIQKGDVIYELVCAEGISLLDFSVGDKVFVKFKEGRNDIQIAYSVKHYIESNSD